MSFTGFEENERKVRIVFWVTLVTTAMEVAFGYLTHSLALLADGWHMTSHAVAMLIALGTYAYLRGKGATSGASGQRILALGGFANAMLLFSVAISLAIESFSRLVSPELIRYREAVIVSVLGLAVNFLCALVLKDREYASCHGCDGVSAPDANIKSAYTHVLSDVLTSVTAIIGLLMAQHFNAPRVDTVLGIIGSLVVGRWALNLARETGSVLLADSAFPHEPKEMANDK